MIIFLIGFRGTGKTTIGKLLAERLNCLWYDSDSAIEESERATIPEIFDSQGESGFRNIEQSVINSLVDRIDSQDLTIVSLGGGALLSDTTRTLLGESGKCVWLKAPAECLIGRIGKDQDTTPRPALTELMPEQEVSHLLRLREPAYSNCADYTLDTGELSPEQVVEQIAKWWSEVDK